MFKAIKVLVALVIIGELLLLFTGYRVLMEERLSRTVPAGDDKVWESTLTQDFDTLEEAKRAYDRPKLLCRYWTGRSVKTSIWWQEPRPDECPFIFKRPGKR